MEAMPADPVLESQGARCPMEESTAAADGLGDGERFVPMADEPAAVPGVIAGAVGSSEADAGVADVASKSRAEKPVVPEEQTKLLKALEGMVRHAVWPSSPLVVPPAVEEDKGEEIERQEA